MLGQQILHQSRESHPCWFVSTSQFVWLEISSFYSIIALTDAPAVQAQTIPPLWSFVCRLMLWKRKCQSANLQTYFAWQMLLIGFEQTMIELRSNCCNGDFFLKTFILPCHFCILLFCLPILVLCRQVFIMPCMLVFTVYYKVTKGNISSPHKHNMNYLFSSMCIACSPKTCINLVRDKTKVPWGGIQRMCSQLNGVHLQIWNATTGTTSV